MKSRSIGLFKYLLATALAVNPGLVQADQQTDTIRDALSKSSIAEVPAKAAEIVSQIKQPDRDRVAGEVMKLLIKAHPTMTVAAVSAISAKCPETAPTAAATAAKHQPKQFKLIAKAAATAAPSQAGGIVKAVCKVVPTYREVALAVAEAAPNAGKEILDALVEIMPDMKAQLEKAIASYHGKVPPVAAILYRANSLSSIDLGDSPAPVGRSSGLRGPTVRPPYVSLRDTPTYVPSGGGIVPPGGRDYASP